MTEPLYSSPLKTSDGRLLPTRGKAVCSWMESNLILGEGDYYGQPLVLRPFQRRFLYRLYEYNPDTGRRRYRVGLFMVGKGNGKTPLAGGVGANELLGPFTPISPRVTIGAASLENADLVFGDLKAMVTGPDEAPSPLRPYVEPFELEMLLKGRQGKAERIAAVASTNDGGRTTAFIGDELHEWLTTKQRRVFLVVSGAVAKRRDGFTLGISTAGVAGSDSPLAELYEYGKKVASGEIVDDAFLFECYEAGPDYDLNDEEQWLQAVMAANPAAGDFLDLDSLRYRFDTIPRFEFERYHLNRWTAAIEVWISPDDWDANDGEPTLAERDPVYAAISGRSWRDVAAVAVVRKDEEGKHHAKVEVIEPTGGKTIDPDAIKAEVRKLHETYDVQQVIYPQLFTQIGLELEEEGLPMVFLPPGPKRATAYSQALFDVVIERRLLHGGDPILRAHAQGAVAKVKEDGFMLEPLKATVPIVGVTALAMAVEAAEADEGGDAGGIVVINL